MILNTIEPKDPEKFNKCLEVYRLIDAQQEIIDEGLDFLNDAQMPKHKDNKDQKQFKKLAMDEVTEIINKENKGQPIGYNAKALTKLTICQIAMQENRGKIAEEVKDVAVDLISQAQVRKYLQGCLLYTSDAADE